MAPRTPEQEAESQALSAKIKESMVAFERLAPVEQAMHMLDQKRSFVRGECGHTTFLDTQPEYVVLAAYRALLAERSVS